MNRSGTPLDSWILTQSWVDPFDHMYDTTHIVGVFTSLHDLQAYMLRNVGHTMVQGHDCYELRYESADRTVNARFCAWRCDVPKIEHDWDGEFKPIYDD